MCAEDAKMCAKECMGGRPTNKTRPSPNPCVMSVRNTFFINQNSTYSVKLWNFEV